MVARVSYDAVTQSAGSSREAKHSSLAMSYPPGLYFLINAHLAVRSIATSICCSMIPTTKLLVCCTACRVSQLMQPNGSECAARNSIAGSPAAWCGQYCALTDRVGSGTPQHPDNSSMSTGIYMQHQGCEPLSSATSYDGLWVWRAKPGVLASMAT